MDNTVRMSISGRFLLSPHILLSEYACALKSSEEWSNDNVKVVLINVELSKRVEEGTPLK